ncbi:MAG: DUF1330 domain-containing protein [Acidiferrobacterales bacterium]
MAAYWLVQINVTNPNAFEEYKKRTPAALAKYGGRFLVRGGRMQELEGSGQYPRIVVVEFPSFDQALACYHSSEYREVKSFRENAAEARIVLVEGV